VVTPSSLSKGDMVGILSTARKITISQLDPFLRLLENWGLQPVLGHTIGAVDDQYAGNDTLRKQDLQHMLDNPEIKAIWCAKGGYGTVRIVDGLDFTAFKENPKWMIGYSDVTVLHSHIHNLNIETLHGQMGDGIDKKTDLTRLGLYDILFGKKHLIEANTRAGVTNRTGSASGVLVGGNLSILYSLCGSPSSIDTNGKILFIEDLDEYLYHVDRMMQNIKRNGMLQGLAGLIVGGMTSMNDNSVPFGKTAEEIVWDAVQEYDYPVCFGFPAGHVKDNRAMVMGRTIDLTVRDGEVKVQF